MSVFNQRIAYHLTANFPPAQIVIDEIFYDEISLNVRIEKHLETYPDIPVYVEKLTEYRK